ncbi:MAG: SDR family NAD(P)-dependent oxidoreductase [Anaerolineae bacterium]
MNMNHHRVVLITGATGAIGRAIARQIAARPGYEVVLAARNEEKARQLALEIIRATGNERVRYEVVDVSRLTSVRELVQRWQGPLHGLVNNAAVTPRSRQETPEGIELQFATNVLGYFWLIETFRNILKQSAPVRVVNVASDYAGGLDVSDLEFKRRRYDNNAAYRQSKQANRMLTVAHAARLQVDGIVVNACHPGGVNSALSNNLGFRGSESPDEGAKMPVWLATDPAGQQHTGQYFSYGRQVRCPFGQDQAGVEALYQACLSYL